MNDDPRGTRGSRPPPRPPEHYVHGADGPVVVVPGRVAAWLERHAGLREIRTRRRGIDPEVDAVLVALAVAAAAWRNTAGSPSGTERRNPAEPAAQSDTMTSQEAADELGCTGRAVRKAIAAGRLHARLVGGRWLVDPEDLAHYRAARAA